MTATRTIARTAVVVVAVLLAGCTDPEAGQMQHPSTAGTDVIVVGVSGAFAENPPTQLRLIKQLLTANATESDLAAVQRRELDAMRTCYRSPEHAEAVRAFIEKRPPVFR